MGWMKSTLTQCPGAMRDEIIEKLCDPAVVPLVISCDVVMGEDTQYADYIVPDTNPYESFGTLNMEGWVGYGDTVRWPMKTPGTIQLDDGRYASWEAFIVDCAKALELPGFGDGALADAEGNAYPFNDACDFFVKAFANLAYDGEPVEDITEDEIRHAGARHPARGPGRPRSRRRSGPRSSRSCRAARASTRSTRSTATARATSR